MLESTNHASIVFICGGNAGIDLLDLVVGQFVDEARTGKAANFNFWTNVFCFGALAITLVMST
jgi:hypothetical protein